MMRLNREEDFRSGIELLTPFFEEHDFELNVYPSSPGADGDYYSAQFVWSMRAVTIVHRFGLEAVTYSIGQWCLDHAAYLDALNVREGSAFPAQDEDPVAGYRALLSDFETRLRPFFEEPDREFIEIAMVQGTRGRPWIPGRE